MDALARTHTVGDDRRRVTRTRARFGDLRISRTSVAHGGVMVPPRPDSESVRVHFFESGELRYRDARSTDADAALISAGQALISTDPATLEVTSREEYRVTSIAIPRATVTGVGLDPPALQHIPATSALLDPIAGFISRAALITDIEATGFSRYYFERLLQEMVLSLLIDSASAHHLPRPSETFALAMAIIAAQYADPALSAHNMAAELKMSLRQLERVFRERGTTLTGEVRRARLEQAVTLLRDTDYRSLTIDEIGRYVGFSGGSSLARALSRDGWAPPARIRAEGGSPTP